MLPLALFLLAALALSSCASPAYYWQAVGGQASLVANREQIDDVIAARDTDPRVREALLEARTILLFADSELGLPAGDAYRHWIETGREAMVWNVVAAPEFSLQPRTWCHLVAGCVAYRGYFDQDEARKFAEKLDGRGLDTGVFPAVAYSTLGWFADPISDTMVFGNGETRLAGLLFHELAHQRLYVKGDSAFSEGYARFVEREGIRRWLESEGRQDALDRWRSSQQLAANARELMAAARQDLADLYAQSLDAEQMRGEKAAIFADLSDQLDREAGGARYWVGPSPNNAQLALIGQYEAGQCAFAALLDEAGGNFEQFHELAAQRAGLSDPDRQAWLDSPCPNVQDRVASHADL